jgi:hypothetical protein
MQYSGIVDAVVDIDSEAGVVLRNDPRGAGGALILRDPLQVLLTTNEVDLIFTRAPYLKRSGSFVPNRESLFGSYLRLVLWPKSGSWRTGHLPQGPHENTSWHTRDY